MVTFQAEFSCTPLELKSLPIYSLPSFNNNSCLKSTIKMKLQESLYNVPMRLYVQFKVLGKCIARVLMGIWSFMMHTM